MLQYLRGPFPLLRVGEILHMLSGHNDLAGDDLDIVLAVAVELLELFQIDVFPIRPDVFETLCGEAVRQRLMVPLSPTNERGAEVEHFLLVSRLLSYPISKNLCEGRGGERDERFSRMWAVLDTDARIEQAQVLGDFRDRGYSRFARPVGDPLLNSHGWRNTLQAVQIGLWQLLDKLARVGRHGLHKAPLP